MKDILKKQVKPEDIPLLLDLLDSMSGAKKIPGGKQAFDNAVLRGMKEELALINKELGNTNITMEDIAIAVQEIRSGKIEKSEVDEDSVELLDKIEDKLEKNLADNKKIIKLQDSIKKSIGPQLAKDLTEKSLEQETFEGPSGVIKSLFSSLKPDFSLRNIMSKIGLAGEGDGLFMGMGNAYLEKRKAKKQFISDSLEMGSTKSEKELAKDWEESNKIRLQQRANEERIAGYKQRGWSEDKIARIKDNPLQKREELANKLANIDPRFKPEDEVLKAPLTAEEKEEAAKLQEEQTEILKNIEVNTRATETIKEPEDKEEKSTSILDGIFSYFKQFLPGISAIIAPVVAVLSSIWSGIASMASGIASIVTKLGGAALNAIKSAGPAAMNALKAGARVLGPAAALAGAGYTGYQAGQWLNKNTGIQEGIASGIEKTQDFFGFSTSDDEREMFQKQHDDYLNSGKMVNKNTAEMWRKAGVEVNPNVIKPTPISRPEKLNPNTADRVYKESANQKAADRISAAPSSTQTIVNAPSTITKQTQNYLGKNGVRTNESSMKRFIQESYT